MLHILLTGGIFISIFRRWLNTLYRRWITRLIFMPCHTAVNWVFTGPGVYRAISHTAERAVNKIFQEEL